MPKARKTCTRCSMRRQKCSRQTPCTRCVKDNAAEQCSREWGNYDPRIHRTYPKVASTIGTSVNHDDSGLTSGGRGEQMSTSTPISPWTPDSFTSLVGTQASSAMPVIAMSSTPNWPDAIGRSATNPDNAGHWSESQRITHLQSLLPTRDQVFNLITYHETSLLWVHGSIHPPSFRHEISQAYQNPNSLSITSLDLRWCALLFSILSASLTCAPKPTAESWGFPPPQKRTLGEQWYQASISCLHLGKYTSKPHICSIQAIQILGLSAHHFGFSNEHFTLLGSALRIAQCLGLHRLSLSQELDDPPPTDTTTPQRRRLWISRETGRRVWAGLCTADWLSIPSSDMYSIHKRHFSTSLPRRVDDVTLQLLDPGEESCLAVDFGNYMYTIASLFVEFHDAITESKTVEEEYDTILKFDSKMRASCPSDLFPQAFTSTTSNSPPWLSYALTVATVATVAHAHRLLTIHRRFLIRSFSEPKYAFSRWASLTAAKHTISTLEAASSDADGPALWSNQAHLVGAAITLCLSILHSPNPQSEEVLEHRGLVNSAITLLSQYRDSPLGSRGIHLLSSMLSGDSRTRYQSKSKPTPEKDKDTLPDVSLLDDRQSIDAMWMRRQDDPLAESEEVEETRGDDGAGFPNVGRGNVRDMGGGEGSAAAAVDISHQDINPSQTRQEVQDQSDPTFSSISSVSGFEGLGNTWSDPMTAAYVDMGLGTSDSGGGVYCLENLFRWR